MRFFALMIITAGLASSAGKANAAVICGPVKHARTLAATKAIRVYKNDGSVSACAAGHRKSIEVGLDGDFTDVWEVMHVRIAGRFVAAVRSCACRESSADEQPSLHVWNVVTRREIARYGPLSEQFPTITDVELAPDGTVAYLVPAAPDSTTIEAHRNADLLDSGAIGARSLTIRGDRLYWRRDGALQSAPVHAVESG